VTTTPLPPPPDRDRPEPNGLTVVDLTALVAGVALAAALPWGFGVSIPTAAGWNWWGSRGGLQFAGLALERACLALVPVVLARRARYGGVARPAEFLAAACGLTGVPRAVSRLVFAVQYNPLWGAGPHDALRRFEAWERWQDETGRVLTPGLFAAACVAVTAWALGRRRWPGWVQTALLLTAWLGLCGGAWALGSKALALLGDPSGASAARRLLEAAAFSAACLVPFKLFFDVPAGAAWHRLRSRLAPRPTWLERLALGLVVALFVANQLLHSSETYPPALWARKWSVLATTAVAVPLGLTLSRRLLPAWGGLDPAE